ncbi:SLBB domain-containing protein [Candidatus Uabimicrobium sp. HlEnr_7]|uniref:SLBB domain-containing protein n=1 Tax=Candidatus Uabimicrobium helgolandensis TaxID=3095367 RepID=UPI0035578408
MMKKYSIFIGCLLLCACNMTDLNVRSTGEAGTELIYLVPGDRIALNTGDVGYVNGDGYFVGIRDIRFFAVGKRVREVIKLLNYNHGVDFNQYKIVSFGRRSIDVRGAVQSPGTYEYPPGEDWNIMNLILKTDGFTSLGQREYLLVRKAWGYPGKFLFIRGLSLPVEEGIGGDNLLLYAHDRVIFPGISQPIYVFGAVKAEAGGVCFSFDGQNKPTLKDSLNQAGGFLKTSNTKNIQVYRVLQNGRRSIVNLDYDVSGGFELQPWDVVYVQSEIPEEVLSEEE